MKKGQTKATFLMKFWKNDENDFQNFIKYGNFGSDFFKTSQNFRKMAKSFYFWKLVSEKAKFG